MNYHLEKVESTIEKQDHIVSSQLVAVVRNHKDLIVGSIKQIYNFDKPVMLNLYDNVGNKISTGHIESIEDGLSIIKEHYENKLELQAKIKSELDKNNELLEQLKISEELYTSNLNVRNYVNNIIDLQDFIDKEKPIEQELSGFIHSSQYNGLPKSVKDAIYHTWFDIDGRIRRASREIDNYIEFLKEY